MKILVSMTGATGAIYGIRLLEVLKETEHQVGLIVSQWAERTIEVETTYSVAEVKGGTLTASVRQGFPFFWNTTPNCQRIRGALLPR